LSENKLQINKDKTEFIVIGSPHNVKKVGVVNLDVNGSLIESKDNIKVLGFFLDNTLTFRTHITKMVRNCYAQLAPLYTLRPVISQKNMIILIKSMVLSHLNYMTIIWGVANQNELKAVERVLKHSARLVTKRRRHDPITESLNELKWLGPKQMFYRSLLCFMYKTIKLESSPTYFKEILNLYPQEQGYFNKLRTNLRINFMPRNEMGKKCITYRGVKAWNELNIDTSVSFKTFKINVCNHLLMSKERL